MPIKREQAEKPVFYHQAAPHGNTPKKKIVSSRKRAIFFNNNLASFW
jgi:hypothetical protein